MGEVLQLTDPQVRRIMREHEILRQARHTHSDPLHPVFAPILKDGAWAGQRCFIVGGGPSLKGFDFGRLRGEKVIAINKAFLDVPFADIMFAMDRNLLGLITSGRLGENYRQAFEAFGGIRLWLDVERSSCPPGIYSIPSAGDIGWTKSLKTGLFHGQNSGYGALNLAIVLGANPIYLLGYDCALGPGGEQNYHDGYPAPTNPDVLNIFRRAFEEGADLLQDGPWIINLNPDSAIRCFEFGDIDTIHGLGQGGLSRPGYVVVSYYTTGTGYEQEIKTLRASLQRYRLPREIFVYEPAGTWRANLNFKSECILRAMDLHPHQDIVFVDADAVIRQYPLLFNELSRRHDFDISACFFKYRPESGDVDELLSGTLWIQNNDAGRKVVEKWHEIGLSRPDVRHQMCLKMAIAELQKGGESIRVYRHPFAYTCIFDYRAASATEPVIEHFQASRRLRREVGYGIDLIAASQGEP